MQRKVGEALRHNQSWEWRQASGRLSVTRFGSGRGQRWLFGHGSLLGRPMGQWGNGQNGGRDRRERSGEMGRSSQLLCSLPILKRAKINCEGRQRYEASMVRRREPESALTAELSNKSARPDSATHSLLGLGRVSDNLCQIISQALLPNAGCSNDPAPRRWLSNTPPDMHISHSGPDALAGANAA